MPRSTIHFPPLVPPPGNGRTATPNGNSTEPNGTPTGSLAASLQLKPPRQPNAINALAAAANDLGIAHLEFKSVVYSGDDRHGKLIVIRGALQRAIRHLDVLIQHEEEAL